MAQSQPARSGDPFEALGDPNRRAILALLAERDRSVGELARGLPISRPAVSRHLRLLREARLVDEEPLGTQRIYRLQAGGLGAVRRYLEQVWGDAAARFRLVAEKTTRQPDDGAGAGAPNPPDAPDRPVGRHAPEAGARPDR